MGSASISNIGRAKTAGEAFDDLQDQAHYDDGHDRYCGTIGGANYGFDMVPLDQKKFTKAAIDRWIDKAIDETDKYGSLNCIQIPKTCKRVAHSSRRGVQTFLFVGWVPD